MTQTLNAQPKANDRSLARLRKEGGVPCVVYGPKQEPISCVVSSAEFVKLYREAGESSVVAVQGLGSDLEVLIHEVTFDPVRGTVQHVDFYAFEKGKDITTNVALEFEGEAPIAKQGGIVNKVLHEVEVTAKPSELPHSIVVDLTQLTDLESRITVADITAPGNVVIENDPESVVVTVEEEHEVEETEAEATEPDMESIEDVDQKGKDDDDAEASDES